MPAVGQGALGIEIRADREDVLALLAPLNDAETAACVTAERAMSRALGGSCQVPLGGYAELQGGMLTLRAFVAEPDGSVVYAAQAQAPAAEAEQLGQQLAAQLSEQGAAAIIAQLAQA